MISLRFSPAIFLGVAVASVLTQNALAEEQDQSRKTPPKSLIQRLFARRIVVTGCVASIGETSFTLLDASYEIEVEEHHIERVRVDGPSTLNPQRKVRFEDVTKVVRKKKINKLADSTIYTGDIRGKYARGQIIRIGVYPSDTKMTNGVCSVYDLDLTHAAEILWKAQGGK